jgi:metal-responsive CopG/Arc/MetJ family transcriptional regulator
MAKQSRKPRQATRARGMTLVSISLPADLLVKIDERATAENRNRSNFMATALQAAVNKAGG